MNIKRATTVYHDHGLLPITKMVVMETKMSELEFIDWWSFYRHDSYTYFHFLTDYVHRYKHIWLQDKRTRGVLFDELRGSHGCLPIVKC